MACLLILIAIGVILYVVSRLSLSDGIDTSADADLKAMEAIDRLLEARDRAREDMWRAADRQDLFGGEAQ